MRLSKTERTAFERAAHRAGLDVSTWLRAVGLAVIKSSHPSTSRVHSMNFHDDDKAITHFLTRTTEADRRRAHQSSKASAAVENMLLSPNEDELIMRSLRGDITHDQFLELVREHVRAQYPDAYPETDHKSGGPR